MRLIAILLLVSVLPGFAQNISEQERFSARMESSDIAPDGLLASKASVMFSADYTQAELEKIQRAFHQMGIDAVSYLEIDRVVAGIDLKNAYSTRFVRRDVKFLIVIQKFNQEYQFRFLKFTPKNMWSKPHQTAWLVHSTNLTDLLTSIYRTLTNTQKRENFLINEFPERETLPNVFASTRTESLVANLKAFKVAIPKMGDANADLQLKQYLEENYHGKYEIVEDSLLEKDLLQKGFRYVMHYVHAPGALAKEMLGYDMSKSESALASVTYPGGNLELKTILSTTSVYKFYLKDLEDRNLYFGTKWDADVTWQDALKNHIDGYRATGRLN